jgi:hypothetical protein
MKSTIVFLLTIKIATAIVSSSCFKSSEVFGTSVGKVASDQFSLQLQMSDLTSIRKITTYGLNDWKAIMLTASNPDGTTNTFDLKTHGYSQTLRNTYTVPQNQFIAKVEVSHTAQIVTWMRFTLSNGFYFETGPKPYNQAIGTKNYSTNRPFIGMISFSDSNYIYGV